MNNENKEEKSLSELLPENVYSELNSFVNTIFNANKNMGSSIARYPSPGDLSYNLCRFVAENAPLIEKYQRGKKQFPMSGENVINKKRPNYAEELEKLRETKNPFDYKIDPFLKDDSCETNVAPNFAAGDIVRVKAAKADEKYFVEDYDKDKKTCLLSYWQRSFAERLFMHYEEKYLEKVENSATQQNKKTDSCETKFKENDLVRVKASDAKKEYIFVDYNEDGSRFCKIAYWSAERNEFIKFLIEVALIELL